MVMAANLAGVPPSCALCERCGWHHKYPDVPLCIYGGPFAGDKPSKPIDVARYLETFYPAAKAKTWPGRLMEIEIETKLRSGRSTPTERS